MNDAKIHSSTSMYTLTPFTFKNSRNHMSNQSLIKQRRVTSQPKSFKTLQLNIFISKNDTTALENTSTSSKTKSTSNNSRSVDFNPTNFKKA